MYRQLAKQRYLLHMSSQCGQLRPKLQRLVGDFGAPKQISTRFESWLRYCTDVAQQRSAKLCTMFGRLLGWYSIYTFWGLLPPNRILPATKFTLRPSLAFSNIGSVTVRHSSSGRQLNFAAWYKECNDGTLTDGANYNMAGQPSRWASARISSLVVFSFFIVFFVWFRAAD